MQRTIEKVTAANTNRVAAKSEEIIDAFIEACVMLDASVFEPFIEENDVFEDKDKYRFLHGMQEAFERTQLMGIEETKMREGECRGCHFGARSLEFYGTSLRPEFAYVICEENGVLKDIFRCYRSIGEMAAINNVP